MNNIENLRLLEIGQFGLFKRNLPEQTTLVYTGENVARLEGLECLTFRAGLIPWLQKGLSQGAWNVVLCHAPVHPAWDTRHGFVQALRHLFLRLRKGRVIGTRFLERDVACPLVMLDFNDEPSISRHVFPLLDRCTLYFKRELPGDFAKAFLNAAPDLRDHPRVQTSDFFNRNAGKLRPISAAVPESTAAAAASLESGKTTDIFFAGTINSTVRRRGFPVLEGLRAQGFRVDVCQGGVPRKEYLQRCASAWLTWSPEGYGWECHRHYEASLCRSVPVMSAPGVFRHQPLVDRLHGFFYPLEGDGLRDSLIAALSDKGRLEAMATEARRHALSHHTHSRIIEHILSSALAAAAGAGPMPEETA